MTTQSESDSIPIDTALLVPAETSQASLALSEETRAVLALPEIREFLGNRNIREEHYELVASGQILPRQLWVENHNTISLLKDRALEQMEKMLASARARSEQTIASDERTKFRTQAQLDYAKTMITMLTEYDWQTAWNLNSVMEKVAERNPLY